MNDTGSPPDGGARLGPKATEDEQPAEVHTRALTLRAGKAIVRCFEAEGQPAEVRAKVAERAHREYVVLVSAPVWGAQDKDPILKTFF